MGEHKTIVISTRGWGRDLLFGERNWYPLDGKGYPETNDGSIYSYIGHLTEAINTTRRGYYAGDGLTMAGNDGDWSSSHFRSETNDAERQTKCLAQGEKHGRECVTGTWVEVQRSEYPPPFRTPVVSLLGGTVRLTTCPTWRYPSESFRVASVFT